ncbi:uncharacterized protein LOC126907552 [Daktulosphaira vitifoliae]|uniref:uncharacterized protein LOC126907552 n=1 Tax=Daktulosphaira vitifoliae TaxID=58002 RepID=UPI0021AAF766|nr:uncharacterized protein LOC126907552 [Daktulosphaira vitifoliae]
MVEQMTTLAEIDEDNKDYQIKKLSLNLNQVPLFLEKCDDDVLISLFNGHSKNIFQRYKIKNFLHIHPSQWSSSREYQQGKQIIKELKVVNDSAERGIKLIQDFNKSITRNESQKQFLLQVVQDYRTQYPQATKKVLNQAYNK